LKLLQAKYDDHMKEAEETIVYLETKLEDAEDTIKDLEAQNTILEMKIARLETSHDYAVGLEKELENMNDMSTKLDELERQNYSLHQALAGRKTHETSQNSLNDVSDLTQKLKIEE
jgi:phage shock protein A